MTPIDFAVFALAVSRVVSLLIDEDGPFRVFERVRVRAGVYRTGELSGAAKLLSCPWCLSVWIAAVLLPLLIPGWGIYMLAVPAASMGSILVRRFAAFS